MEAGRVQAGSIHLGENSENPVMFIPLSARRLPALAFARCGVEKGVFLNENLKP